MFNWLHWLEILEEAKQTGAFDHAGSYGSIISYVIVTVLGLIGTALGILKKKAKPGSKWERLFTMLIKQNEKQIELTEEILHDKKCDGEQKQGPKQKPLKTKKVK